MLDQKQIRDAEKYIQDNNCIKKTKVDNKIIQKYKDLSRESLRLAIESEKQNISLLWGIVCSYYSMYYIANGGLLKIGYKTTDFHRHKATQMALIVYLRNKIDKDLIDNYTESINEANQLAQIEFDELIQDYSNELIKRGNFQYDMSRAVLRSKTHTSINRAKRFIEILELFLME